MSLTPKIEMKKTCRGFARADFDDLYSQKCSIQKSSLATQDAIWLGVDNTGPQMGNREVGDRMHLSREHVKALLPSLTKFAKTGNLK